MPGALARCDQCGKKNRLPQRREFTEIAFDRFVRSPSCKMSDRDTLSEEIANARLNGGRWSRIKESLESAGLTIYDREDALAMARVIIRTKSRINGRDMFYMGLVCTLVFLVATAIQYGLGWQTIYVSASLIAIGGVYTVVGAVKWITGFNIQ